jgi:hypothetical protein
VRVHPEPTFDSVDGAKGFMSKNGIPLAELEHGGDGPEGDDVTAGPTGGERRRRERRDPVDFQRIDGMALLSRKFEPVRIIEVSLIQGRANRMRGKTFEPFVQWASRSFAVTLVLIAVLVPIRAFADEPSPPIEGQSQTVQNHCQFLMEKASKELREVGQALEGRSWVQRKKLKDITARIEAISEQLERSWQESKPSANESPAAISH